MDLDISGTVEERRAKVESFCQRINADFYGNGRKGLMEETSDFMTRMQTLEEERDRQHTQNRHRLNMIIGLLTAIAGYLAIYRPHF